MEAGPIGLGVGVDELAAWHDRKYDIQVWQLSTTLDGTAQLWVCGWAGVGKLKSMTMRDETLACKTWLRCPTQRTRCKTEQEGAT